MLTSVISILVGIILPVPITSRPIDWKCLFYIMAMGFTLVWVLYKYALKPVQNLIGLKYYKIAFQLIN